MRTALLVGVVAVIAGCGDDREAPPAERPSAAPVPQGVPLYYSWECDGGLHLTMKNLLQDRAISLGTHEGARKLPQVVSASGARYSDGTITFWTKGNTATYERAGSPPVNCRVVSSGDSAP